MAKQTIDITTPHPGWTGDPFPTAFGKANANFDELYEAVGSISTIVEDVEQLKTEIEEKVDTALEDVDEKVAQAEQQLEQAVATIPALVDTAIAGRIPGKNLLINGNFDFSQRGVTGSRTSAAVEAIYTMDRWICGFVNVNGNWGVGGTTFGEIPGSRRFLGYNIASVPNNNSSAYVGQKVEGAGTLAGKTVTLSVWARSNVAGKKMGMRALQLFGTGGSTTTSTEAPNVVTLTTAFKRYSFTVTLPSVAGKTIGTSGDDGMLVVLDYCGPAPLYGGALAGQTGLFEVAQAQLEEGGTATGFEFRPLGLELSLCQRYYEKSYLLDVDPGTTSSWGRCGEFLAVQRTGSNAWIQRFAVTKR
ncbi:hypothetical protein, partial [Stenotrophomonas sp. P5_B8]